jgi:hypothetical protein
MTSPRITIGMATYDDFEGVWCTVQSVFLHNEWEESTDVQIVIVDTSPVGSEHRQLVQDFVRKGGHEIKGGRTPNIKYIDMAGFPGTTTPRNAIFKHADAPIVCVMDCHVMLPSNALKRLLDWFESNPDSQDLIHGPMMYDNLHAISTHFADQFRGGMWGTWGTAWKSPEGEVFVCEGEEVTDENRERKSDGRTHYHDLMTLEELTQDAQGNVYLPSGELLPSLPWGGHDRELIARGFTECGRPDNDDAFEIPGCGMGLFASRKDSWLEFAANCSGFGGEEMNIHTKYRLAGRKAICLPFLKWNHRFGRAGGAPYPIPLAAKIRNYVLWAKEMDISTDRIHTHFVKSGQFPQERWDKLVEDPKGFHVELKPQQKTSGHAALDYVFLQSAMNARDLKEHAENIRSMASRVKSVTAFVKRADWEPMLAAGFPKTLTVYQSEDTPLVDQTHEAVKQQNAKDSRQIVSYTTHRAKEGQSVEPLDVDSIEPSDLLVIDKVNDSQYLVDVLAKHGDKAKQLIMIRGTQAFGEKSEPDPNKPGMFYAIKDWIAKNPNWFVLQHWANQYGLTVLACDPIARPEKEVRPWPKGNGPGTELKAILGSVGINPSPNCSCNSRMRQMDEWGVEGCRENFETIIGWLEEKAAEWGWTARPTDRAVEVEGEEVHKLTLKEKLSIGWKSLTTGIVFSVNWVDPYPGLVEESIRRAEVKEQSRCTKDCDPALCKKPGCKKAKT